MADKQFSFHPADNNTSLKSYLHAGIDTTTQFDGDINNQNVDSSFYFHGRSNHVRLLIDENGDVINRYTYDPFGQELSSETTETVGNPFRFIGGYFDEELLQYHLGAREYVPSLGIFTAYDPVRGGFTEPLTLHRYLYSLNDPINRFDPTGELSLINTTTTAANYASRFSTAYDVGSSIKQYATMITTGVSMSNIALSIAIDVGMEVGGGKVFDALSGVGSRLIKKFRGGKHGDTKLPVGDELDSHHMPPDSVNGLPTNDGPAIQMDPADHFRTRSHPRMPGNREYRKMLDNLIQDDRMRDAMAVELRDIRRIARESGEPRKYNEALWEMLEYAESIGLLDK